MLNNINLEKLNLLLFLIFPFSFIVGPVLVETLLFFLILFNFILKKIHFEKNIFFYLLIIFYLIVILNLYITDNSSYYKSFAFVRIIFLIVIVKNILNSLENLREIYYRYIFIIFFVVLLLTIHSALIFFIQYDYSLRVSSVFFEEKILGSYVSKLFFFSTPLFFLFNIKKKNSYYLLGLIFICFVTFLVLISGERASIFNLFFYIFLFFILSNDIKKKYKFSFLLLVFLIVSFSITISDRIKFRAISQTAAQLGLFGPEKYTEKLINGRWYAYIKEEKIYFAPLKHKLMHETAFKIFKDNIILGSGIKTFRTFCKKQKYSVEYIHPQLNEMYITGKWKYPYEGFDKQHGCSTHPHNYFFETISELGIFGFILISVLFISSAYIIIKYKRELNNYQLSLLLPIVVLFFPLNSTGSLLNNWTSLYLSIFIGFYYYFINYELNKLQNKN